MRAELGKLYRDIATSFEGTATGRAEYLGDGPSVRLARIGKDEKVVEMWLPEGRLEPAGDTPAPGFV